MAQSPTKQQSKDVSEVQQLKQEFESIMKSTKAEEKENEALMKQIDADMVKRWQAAHLIKDKDKRLLYLKLCKLNKWIFNGNKHMRFCDDSGKLWFTQIVDYSGNVSFMPKQNKESKTPETKELSNFVDAMHVQWLEEYFMHWLPANEAMLKYQHMATKPSSKK